MPSTRGDPPARSLAQVAEVHGGFSSSSPKATLDILAMSLSMSLLVLQHLATVLCLHFAPLCQWASTDQWPWLWLSVAALLRPGQSLCWPLYNLIKPAARPSLIRRFPQDAAVLGPTEFLMLGPSSTGWDVLLPASRKPEPRLRPLLSLAATFALFLPPGATGNLGVELWFSRSSPFLWQGSRPAHTSCSVHQGVPALALFLEREEWWKRFADLLLLTAQGDKVVILGDLNSRLCQPLNNRVGALAWESRTVPPDPFFRIFRVLDLWVPSTFEECGLSHTWVAPGGQAVSRIDFVLVPSAWWVPLGGSRVLFQADFGQTGLDHFVVCLFVDFTLTARVPFRATAQKFDVASACPPESAHIVRAICASAPEVA